MKKLLLFVLVLILGVAGYYWYAFSHAGGGNSGPKTPPIVLKQHSDSFNLSVANTLNAYFDMQSAFVEADSAKAKEYCKKMLVLLDSIRLKELKKDTSGIYMTDSLTLENIRSNAKSLLLQTDITEMRKDFSMVNENLYPFLKAINYKGPDMYWQKCPMAFGEDKPANWLSKTIEINNPYLGKFHPEYKGSMLHCGEILDTIKAQ
jgi:hypothetical protein